jgi:hypothetical protein
MTRPGRSHKFGGRFAPSPVNRANRPLSATLTGWLSYAKVIKGPAHRVCAYWIFSFTSRTSSRAYWELIPDTYAGVSSAAAAAGSAGATAASSSAAGSTGAAASGTGSATGSSGPGSPAAAMPSSGNFDGDRA